MSRFASVLVAAIALSAAPALAQSTSGYAATPMAAPERASFITRSVLWHCTDSVCTAPKTGSRPEIMCELAVKEVGKLSAFTVDGTALDDDKLAKCNARAK